MKTTLSAIALFFILAVGGAAPAEAARYVALGDSITVGRIATPDSRGYAFLLHTHLRATRGSDWTLINRAVGGVKVAHVKTVQLPLAVIDDPDVVTLYIGINDITTSRQTGETVEELRARFETNYASIIARLHSQTRAYVIAANVPDVSRMPRYADYTQAQRDDLRARTLAVDSAIAGVVAAQKVPLVNLFDAPFSYQATNFASDGFHPNNVGHAYIAALFQEKMASLLTVTKTADTNDGVCDTDCSLREAITAANDEASHPGADTILFNLRPTMSPLVGLTSPLPVLNHDITIQGPAGGITVRRTNGGEYGVFSVAGAEVQLSRLTITGGKSGAATDGGGVLNVNGVLTLGECVFTANQAGGHGGAVANHGGRVNLSNCTLYGNTAGGSTSRGGGIYNEAGTVSATNCTFSGNFAGRRGGAFCNFGGLNSASRANAALHHCTVSGNAAGEPLKGDAPGAGGIDNTRGNLSLDGTLLANGSALNLANTGGSIVSQGYNLCDDDGGGFLDGPGDLIDTDPRFDPAGLKNNGGPTPTIALRTDSPAIDAGREEVDVARDQRGLSRPVRLSPILHGDGTGDGSDIGAVEMEVPGLRALSAEGVVLQEGQAGASGTVTVAFPVKLTTPVSRDVTVDWSTADGTAQHGSDYAAASGTLTIPSGHLAATILVSVKGDTLQEEDETFFVNLSNPVNAVISKKDTVCFIIDDDAPPSVSVNNVTVREGSSLKAPTAAFFTVSLSEPTSQTVNVDCLVSPSGTYPAVPVADFVASPSTTLTFAPGETVKKLNVLIIGDSMDEEDETFTVSLARPVNATLETGQSQGRGLILDDDAAPNLRINNIAVVEGNSPSGLPGSAVASFTVSLSAASGKKVSVKYATGTPGTKPATPGIDYVTVPSTLLTFNPGETSKQISVPVNGDLLDEDDKQFLVGLVTPVNATLDDHEGFCRILDDDAQPVITISDVSVNEGNTTATFANFVVSLSAPSGKTVTVQADIIPTGAYPATPDIDYVNQSPTQLVFAPGRTSLTYNVFVKGDRTPEADETFEVVLSKPVNVTVADGLGLGTIVDEEGPAMSIKDIGATDEGNPGSPGHATFTVSLAVPSTRTVTVQYATVDGVAKAGQDYIAASGTLTFNPGETTKSLTVDFIGDAVVEANETLFLDLKTPVNATLVKSRGSVYIRNDDGITAPTVSAMNVVLHPISCGPMPAKPAK